MRTLLTRRLLLAALPGAALLPLARPAAAHSYKAGDVEIGHPWSRAAIARGTGAGFMALRNTGSQPDRLVSARAAIARTVEIHTHIREGEVMRMRPVEGGIPLPPGVEVKLAPGGYHLMLIGLKEAMAQGQRVPVTLVFERGGEITVELAVEAAGAQGGGHQH
ncbi:copper chaperone PCu(A)C [Roseomonas sp. GC11]|uniref:copper chaperone PCu(A)C n=1 Tax=Roseomonas sp. GC11 TaxID=2950546 RepID=UPI00210B2A21|nr:copper chaperone PCu(A)C [Roseomonas sp. GC11]MCQ4161063.1 copper chaperone PCu(A)C [Roseomonas sp. GC11]